MFFSGKEEKIVRLVSFVLSVLALISLTFFSVFSYAEKTTCDFYSDYHCLARQAVKKQDPALCEKYKGRPSTNKEYKIYCYIEVSKKWKDISLCDNVPKERGYYGDLYDCISNIAKNNNDSKLCEKLKGYRSDIYGKNEEGCFKKVGQ